MQLKICKGIEIHEKEIKKTKKTGKGCKKSGVKRIEIHSIRHSNITLLENEIGSATTKAISSRCGHTNTKMTLHYAHIYEGTDQKIANELDEMMKERKNNKCQQKTTIENSVSEA